MLMATDGPTPPPCDDEVFRTGIVVCHINSVSSNRLERFIQRIAKISGQRVDWSFAGGRGVVRALGDIAKVRAALVTNERAAKRLQVETLMENTGNLVRTNAGAWLAKTSRLYRAGATRRYRTKILAIEALGRSGHHGHGIYWVEDSARV